MKNKFNPANWLESTRLSQWVLSQHSELDKENFLMWLGSVSYLSPDKCHAVLEHLDMVNLFGDGPVLHLPIKGVWFKMIAAGEKKEEYRDVKHFYIKRLCLDWRYDIAYNRLPEHPVSHIFDTPGGTYLSVKSFQTFDVLHLTAGYGDHRPQLWAEIESITIGRGNPDWGAEHGKDYFVIQIGKILNTKNFVLQSEPSSGTNV